MKNYGLTWTVATCLCLSGLACQRQSPEAGSAEVPGAGPAVIEEEIGPAPEGQSEPPFDEPGDPPSGGDDEVHMDRPGAGDVSLSLMSWDETEQLIASKKGRVVVLDVWSTSCVPCVREFPQFVHLHRELGDDVACISYSMDYSGRESRPPETYREPVLEFLAAQQAAFDNVLGTDDPDVLYQRLNLAAPPAVYIYDREGILRKRFDNEDSAGEEFSYERDVIPFVESLLAES